MNQTTNEPVHHEQKAGKNVKSAIALITLILLTTVLKSFGSALLVTGLLALIVLVASKADKAYKIKEEKGNPAPKKSTVIALCILAVIGISSMVSTFNKLYSPTGAVQEQVPVVPKTAEQIAEEAKQAKIAGDKLKAERAEYLKTPAGKLCQKHPSWTKDDCDSLIKREIWIGMTTDMIKYLRGNPNHVNPSNYGGGIRYQYCWNDHTPSCFYDNNADGILDSYN